MSVIFIASGPSPAGGGFGIGLAAYWPRFSGLKEHLAGYREGVEQRPEALGGDGVSAGLVDTAPAAHTAGELPAKSGIDLIVCHVGTYATLRARCCRSSSTAASGCGATGEGGAAVRGGVGGGGVIHLTSDNIQFTVYTDD